MLALRLHGSRGICAQYRGTSCHAHVAQPSITGCGRPTALARSYATESKKSDDRASTEGAESKNHPRKSRNSKKSNPPKGKSNTKNPKSTSPNTKSADAPTTDLTNNGAKKTNAKAEDESPEDSDPKANTIKILREATSLLREFQANPSKFASKKPSLAKDGDPRRSLKTQFTPIKGAPKYDERQTKIFHDTLTVLGDALQIYAQGTAGKDQQSNAEVLAARDAMAQATVTNTGSHKARSEAKSSGKSEKKAADMKETQSPKKKAEAEPEAGPKPASDQEPEPQPETRSDPSEEPRPAPSPEKKPQERSKKKDESQQKSQPQDSTKKKGQSQQKPEKNATNQVSVKMAKKSKAKTAPQPSISEEVSQSIAAVVARAQADTKSQGGASKSSIKDRVKSRSGDSKTKEKKKKTHDIKVENFRADPAAALTPIAVDMKPVPLIQYGLDRVLFKDGVYPLQDPRTRVWNFDPYLATIMPVNEFDFEALKEYITSSKDQKLIGITKEQEKKYTGSTSSMTSTLAHFHYLLSHWRPINCARLSKNFDIGLEGFSGIMKSPAATILNYKDGVYAIDADKEWDTETVLSMLGKSMEKLLTVPKDEFVKYHRSKSHELTEEEKGQEESYHYTTYGDFMMRSQLDAYDPRLPGTGVYDLKTRAVVSIRMDATHVDKGVGYEIRQRDGNWESFEREYFDMIRSAFLKYSLQVRMGRMDGIFVAFHNTERIFGFQYIPLEEMDLSLHGTTNKSLGDREFTASLKLFNELLNQATAKFPKQSLRVHVETRPSEQVPFLYFFAEPVDDEQIKNIQERGKGDVEKFRAKLGIPLGQKVDVEAEPAMKESDDVVDTVEVEDAVEIEEETTEEAGEVDGEEEDSDQVWEDMMDVVEDTMDKDAEGITAIREAIQEALEQSGLLQAKSSEEAQHYVEALLKSIVNPNAELAKSERETEQDDEVVQESTEAEPVDPTTEPKPSTIGSIFNWFRPSTPKTEVPTKETTKEDALPEDASPDDAAEIKDAMKEAEKGPSPELVELLVKLTSRVGTSAASKIANDKAKQQELSDDQARLQAFESILLDMMPNVLESVEEADEKDPPAAETDGSSTTTKSQESKAQKDSLFAMYVTIRNKVNDQPVDRPENLKSSDTWDIEYAMEELHGERAEKLYKACKTRRKASQGQNGKEKSFKTMFDGSLPQHIMAGRTFRRREDEIAKTQPVWIVGQPAPLPAAEVFKGAGVKLVHVLPSLEHGQLNPSQLPDSGVLGMAEPRRRSRNLRDWLRPSQHQDSIGMPKKDAPDENKNADEGPSVDKDSSTDFVAELRKGEENKVSSFKEWREKAKQRDNP